MHTPSSINPASLPHPQRDVFEALQRQVANLEGHLTASHSQVAELKGLVAALRELTERQESLIRELHAARFGKSSERLTPDERQLVFEDLEVALAQTETETAETEQNTASGTQRRKKRKPANRNLGNLPKDLPRIEQVIEPESTVCPCGCGQMHRIGEDRTERLDIIPAQVQVIVTVRPKYACRSCTEGVTQAAAPAHIVEGGLPSEGAIAHVLIAKYADHLPLYRQAGILKRSGIDIHRSTLAGWVGKAAFHLTPVVDRLAEHLKTSSKLLMDETTAPVLDPGRGKTKTGYLWALARDDRAWAGNDPPGVVYHYAPGRSGKHAETLLDGFDGILQIDGYAGYNRLARPTREGGKPVRFAFCWAHCRRKLREIFDSDGSPIAAQGLHRIAELYAIEAEVRGRTAEKRLAVRKARSAPLVADFGIWLARQRQRVSAKSRLGQKLGYIARHFDGLKVFLEDGRVEMDTNNVENLIRPLTLNRKNALFAGHDEGGAAWGRIASLIETCKLNGVEPFAYLKATLEAIARGLPQSRLDELLPWNFQKS
jgi:transposase